MRASRLLEAEHDLAQVGLAQPVGREPAQHAALLAERRRLVERAALAGDDDDEPRPARLGMAQEAAQRLMGLGLVHAVQVERAVDRAAAARELALQPPLDRRERQGAGLAGLGLGARPRAAAGGAAGAFGGGGFEGAGRLAPRRRETLRATSVQSAISSSLRRLRRCGGGASFTARLRRA